MPGHRHGARAEACGSGFSDPFATMSSDRIIRDRLVVPPPIAWALTGVCLLLATVGILTIYVVDTHYYAGNDGPRNAAKQAVILGLSLAVGYGVWRIGHVRLRDYASLVFIASLVLLVPPVIARFTDFTFGGVIPRLNGAYRWIRLPGFQLQPSEIMKVALILVMALLLRNRAKLRTWRGVLIPLALAAGPMALILLEPDLGTCLLMPPVLLLMMFVAGAKKRHLGAVVLIAIGLAPLGWWNIHHYQRMRIVSVLLQTDSLRQAILDAPEKYAFLATPREALRWRVASGYQLVASKNAIGSGGLAGYGWGHGPYVQYPLLPDRHNDFIFAMIGHQWGLAGCLGILAAYGIIGLMGMIIAARTRDIFGRLLVVGLTGLIVLQAMVNMSMTLGLMPVTGLTLPLVSQGGCSQLMVVLSVALIISVAAHRPFTLSSRTVPEKAQAHQDRSALIVFNPPPEAGADASANNRLPINGSAGVLPFHSAKGGGSP